MQLVSRGKVQGELVPPQLVSECVSVCVCVILEAHVKDTNGTKREREREY